MKKKSEYDMELKPLGSHQMGKKPSNKSKQTAASKCRDCRSSDGKCIYTSVDVSPETMREYMTDLIQQTLRMIRDGSVDMYPVKLGYEPFTGVSVWDYEGLVELFIASGHCEKCSRNFVNSFSEILDDNGNYENIMVVTNIQSAKDDASWQYKKRNPNHIDII